MQKVTAHWTGQKVAFKVSSGSGHEAMVDESATNFGADEGMRPTEMLLGALAACTGINAVLLLKKFKQPYRTVDVEVEGDQLQDWPHTFTEIRITFVIGWEGKFDRKLVDEALDLSVNRYCPVDATLTHGTRIEFERRDEKA